MNQGLSDYATTLRARWRWLAWGMLAAVATATVALLIVAPSYRSEATVFVRTPGDVSRAMDGGDSYARQRAQTFAALAGSARVADRVRGETSDVVATDVSAVVRPNTVLIDLAVSASDPEVAHRTAEIYLRVLSDEVRQLESTPGSVVPRAELVTVDPPGVPTRRTAWGMPIAVVLLGAALIGVVVGALTAVLRSLFDHRLWDRRDVERIAGVPVLGPISDDVSARIIARKMIGDRNSGRILLVTAPAADAGIADVGGALLRGLPGDDADKVMVAVDEFGDDLNVAELRAQRGYTVLRCAPILENADVDRSAGEADAIALVVTLGETTDDQLRRACALLVAQPPVTVVLADKDGLSAEPMDAEEKANA